MTERNINRSFLSKFRSSRDNSCDHTKININDDCLSNYLKIFTEICNNNEGLETKSVIAYLNVLVYLSKDLLDKFANNDYFIISVYSIIKYSLWQMNRCVRTAALRCVRYYLVNYRHVELFMRMRIDYLLIRSLDISYEDAVNNQYRGNDDAERIQSIRLIYRLSLIAPKLFPSTLINTMAGVCLIDIDKTAGTLDLAIRPILMIMCNLVIINPIVATHSRVLDALQAVIFNADGKTWRLNFRIIEAVLLTQLKLVAHSHWRDILPISYFSKTLTPFSILSKVQSSNKLDAGYQMNYTDEQSDFESTSISVLCTILQSWPGLLYLCSSNNKPILSITGILAVGCSAIRDRILDLLFQIFNISHPPLDCTDFFSCLRALADQRSARNNPSWCLEDEFLVAQCMDCLTYVSPSRVNVLDNYEVILLGVFVHNNLFEALANAVADEKESTSARAGILLANISYKVSILFPSDHPLNRRSNTEKLLNNPKAHKALLWIEQLHKELEHCQYEITPFMAYLIQQHPNNNINGDFILSKRYLQPSNIDEILESSCIIPSAVPVKKSASLSKVPLNNRLSALLDQVSRYCHLFDVTSTADDNNRPYYDQWNWDLLLILARTLTDSKLLVNFDKDLLNRILKILMKFFTPKSDDTTANKTTNAYYDMKFAGSTFASLPLTWKHSSKAAFVITDLIGFMVEYSKNSESQEDLTFFLSTTRSYICGCLKSVVIDDKLTEITAMRSDDISTTNDCFFTEYDLNYKCSSYLILAIGRLSASDLGESFLERSGIVEIFKMLLDYSKSDLYTKLILGSLDYARPALGRRLLSIASTSINLLTRRYAIKFLRVLLRAKVPFFANWAVNILLKQIHDSDAAVKNMAFDILQEACEDESVINNLSIDSMAILQSGYFGYMLFSRLFSLPIHFDKLVNRKSTNTMLDIWREKNYDLEYCKQLDNKLMEHFTSYENQSFNADDPDEGRPSNRPRHKSKELILPCHPYSSLCSHKAGLELLLNSGFIEDCADIVAKEHKNIIYEHKCHLPEGGGFVPLDYYELHVRANMLAICHIATSALGLDCILNMDVPSMISDITKLHPSLNVRGTGIICLGLIGSTHRGANILSNLDWMALRSDRFDKWPLLLDVYHHLYQTREEAKRQIHAGKHPISRKSSKTYVSESVDGFSEEIDIGTSVGYSAFAMPLDSDDIGQRSRKVTYELIDNTKNGTTTQVKAYAKSVDDSIIKSRTRTTTSSSSSNLFADDEKQTKFNRLIQHRRDHSTGAASMFNIQIDDTVATFSPHDVLGIATMRRLQKRSRTGLFQNSIPLNRLSLGGNQIDGLDQSLTSGNMDLFSNIHSDSISYPSFTKRRKKFSSLITPRSNLSKYRGLVVPINFDDMTINISPNVNHLPTKVSMSDYQNIHPSCQLSYQDSDSNNLSTKSPSESASKSTKQHLINTISNGVDVRGFEKEDNGVSIPTYGTSGYISLEESSCVLDLALLAVDDNSDTSLDLYKTQRSSSDQRPVTGNNAAPLRPRAITTSNCGGAQISHEYSGANNLNYRDRSIPNIIINVRDNVVFVDGNFPKIHESQAGLTYHHEDYCLHIGCVAGKGVPVPSSVVEFRKEILQAVSGLIVLGPKTKKMEMGLAKLKSNQTQQMWSDLCLYSEICILLSLYNYSRQSRLYIQDLFIAVPMTKLIDDMKSCLEEFTRQPESRCSYYTHL